MRSGAAVGSVALLVALTACSGSGSGEPESTALPDVTLAGFDGGAGVDLGELRGPAVINFWASWCGPCRREMPLLEQFHEQHGDQVRVLGIDFQDAQPEKAAELVRDSGVTYDLVSDPEGEVNGRDGFPNLRGLPFWVLVDEDGTIVHLEATEVTSVDDITGMVRDDLGLAL